MNDLRRRARQRRTHHRVEPVEAVNERRAHASGHKLAQPVRGKRPADGRQHATLRQLIEQRPQRPEVLQVP